MATKKPICLYAGELKELQAGDDLGVAGGESVSIPYQPEAPDDPSDGDLWIDSDENSAAQQLANSGTAVIDFGAAPGTNMVTTTVSGQTGIQAGSAVLPFMMAEATADHNAYEHLLAPIRLTGGNIVPGEGFDIVAVTDHRLTGTFNVRWSWA